MRVVVEERRGRASGLRSSVEQLPTNWLELTVKPQCAGAGGGDEAAPAAAAAMAVRGVALQRHGVGIGGTAWLGAALLARHLVCCLPRGALAGAQVVELGSGVGLLAAVVARLGAHVVATDTPDVVRPPRDRQS